MKLLKNSIVMGLHDLVRPIVVDDDSLTPIRKKVYTLVYRAVIVNVSMPVRSIKEEVHIQCGCLETP